MFINTYLISRSTKMEPCKYKTKIPKEVSITAATIVVYARKGNPRINTRIAEDSSIIGNIEVI